MKQESVNLLKLLGNPYRLKIAYLLAQGGQTNESMMQATGLSTQSFTHHLTRFRNRGFVSGRRDGRYVIYSLYDPKGDISDLLGVLAQQYLPQEVKDEVFRSFQREIPREIPRKIPLDS